MPYLDFNAKEVQPEQSFTCVPRGQYIACVQTSDLRLNRKATGHLLTLTFVIQEGEYKGHRIFDNVNIQHDNPKVQRIGQAHLSALCHATHVLKLENSSQLHDIPVKIDVSIEEGSNGYPDRNKIVGFASITKPQLSTLSDDDIPF